MNNDIVSGIICILLLAFFAWHKKTLTLLGVITAAILGFVVVYCGGKVAFFVLAVTFLCTVAIGKIFKKKREAIVKDLHEKHGKRDAFQVLANVLVGSISLVIYKATDDVVFFHAYASVMAASLADSMASELGVLSQEKTRDICTLKEIPKGLSGGVSVLGLLASFFGSFVIGTLYSLGTKDVSVLWLVTILGFIGSFIDSFFGSLIQVKYCCKECKKITEKKIHCRKKTEYYRGIRFVNNDIVNILNNVFTFFLTLLFYFFW